MPLMPDSALQIFFSNLYCKALGKKCCPHYFFPKTIKNWLFFASPLRLRYIQFLSVKLLILSYPSVLTFVFWVRNETVLLKF